MQGVELFRDYISEDIVNNIMNLISSTILSTITYNKTMTVASIGLSKLIFYR